MAYILAYLIVINITSFILFGIDKRKAFHARRRISEKTLLRSVGIGGRLGGIIGMSYFHHKTMKSSFLWKFRVVAIARLVATTVMLGYMQQ